MRVDSGSGSLVAVVILCAVCTTSLPCSNPDIPALAPGLALAADGDPAPAALLPSRGWPVSSARNALDPESYVVHDGRYCRVRTTAGAEAARDIAVWADRYLNAFRRVFSGRFKIRGKLTLVVYAHREEFLRRYRSVYGGDTEPRKGLYAPHLRETWITLDAAPARGQGEARRSQRVLPLETTQHEFTHHLLHFFTGQETLPPWFNEGAACFFQYWNIEQSRHDNIGGNIARARRGYYGYFPRVIQSVHGSEEFVPLAALLALDYEQFHVRDRQREVVHYSESWALVNFLASTDEGKPYFERIVATLARGGDLRDVFTPSTVAALEKAWYRDIAERIIPAAGERFAPHGAVR